MYNKLQSNNITWVWKIIVDRYWETELTKSIDYFEFSTNIGLIYYTYYIGILYINNNIIILVSIN